MVTHDRKSIICRTVVWTVITLCALTSLGLVANGVPDEWHDTPSIAGLLLAVMTGMAAATMAVIRHIDRALLTYLTGYQDGMSDGAKIGHVVPLVRD